MIRKQISKFLCRKDKGYTYFEVPKNNQKIYTKDFQFEHNLMEAEITIRALIGHSSQNDFLNIKIQKKKTSNIYHSGDDYKKEYDNIDDFFVSFPVGRAGNYTQKTFKISAFPNDIIRFEISNPGGYTLRDCEIIIVQDVVVEEDYPLISYQYSPTGTFSYPKDLQKGGYIQSVHPNFLDKMIKVSIDDQEMIRIPKFYYKTEVISKENEKKILRFISDIPLPGYEIHPAFMNNEKEIECFYYGAYPASQDGSKACSIKGAAVWGVTSLSKAKQACEARNVGGITGFHPLSIHELDAIKMLFLADLSGQYIDRFIIAPDLEWRGIFKLWGTKCLIDGIKTEHSGGKAIVHIFDNKGNKEYVNTGYSPPTSSSGMYIAETSRKKGNGFDLSSSFLPALTNGEGRYGFFGDLFEEPRSSEHKYWCYGFTGNRDFHKGLFSLCGRVSETETSGLPFRLAKI